MRKIFQACFYRGITFYFNGSAIFYLFFAAGGVCLWRGRGVEHQQAGYQYGSYKAKADQVFFLHGNGFEVGRK